MYRYIFKRYEKKYILSSEQYSELLKILSFNTVPDSHGESDICNVYCDTDDYRIIRTSVQKPVYKEKLRLRCYGVPDNSSPCFLELKKKYKGVVYKRRISADYKNGLLYVNCRNPELPTSQIKNELDYFRKIYNNPTPKVSIFYRRTAFYDRNDENVRFTFDKDLRYRNYDLDLKNGIYGKLIIPEDRIIMEIKTAGAVPMWVSEILDTLKIYPTSFSKYGTAYVDMLKTQNITAAILIPHGGIYHAG